jgi:hypothetical protein
MAMGCFQEVEAAPVMPSAAGKNFPISAKMSATSGRFLMIISV